MQVITQAAILLTIGISGPALGERAITPGELKKHNTEADCWMAIDGVVYNMSPYVKLHQEDCKKIKFTDHCGRDASLVWNKKERSHSPHKKKSLRNLLKMKVGTFSL